MDMNEPTRWTGLLQQASENYHVVDSYLRGSDWSVPIGLAALCLLVALSLPRTRRYISSWWSSVRGYVVQWSQGKTMRKERELSQRCYIKDGIIELIEDAKEKNIFTDVEANDWYRFFVRKFPDFKNCIEKIEGNKAIKAELAGSRDADGNIVVMPFPKEVPATAAA